MLSAKIFLSNIYIISFEIIEASHLLAKHDPIISKLVQKRCPAKRNKLANFKVNILQCPKYPGVTLDKKKMF